MQAYNLHSINTEGYQLMVYPSNKMGPLRTTFGLIQLFINSDTADVYNRSYPKFQNLISNIGGAVQLVLFLFTGIVRYISYQFYRIDRANELMSYDNSTNNNSQMIREMEQKKNYESMYSSIVANTHGDVDINQPVISGIPDNFLRMKRSLLKLSSKNLILSCLSKRRNNNNNILSRYDKIIKMKLSPNYILNSLDDLEKIKLLLFDEHQAKVFSNIPKFTIEENEVFVNNNLYKHNDDNLIVGHISHMKQNNLNEMNEKILNLFNN